MAHQEERGPRIGCAAWPAMQGEQIHRRTTDTEQGSIVRQTKEKSVYWRVEFDLARLQLTPAGPPQSSPIEHLMPFAQLCARRCHLWSAT